MTQIDQFESAFKSAERDLYPYQALTFKSILLITDLNDSESLAFLHKSKHYLSHVNATNDSHWAVLDGDKSAKIGSLIDEVEKLSPDLIVTYRNLHSEGCKWNYSLGEQIDILTQAVAKPVLLLPHPHDLDKLSDHIMENTDRIMAMTDHLNGDADLINYGAAFTSNGGTLWLTHVEDRMLFDRYIKAISKIPSIETVDAETALHDKLLEDANNFIATCKQTLNAERNDLKIESVVRFGHHISEYRKIISDHEIDLLIMNTKDADQLAMHGLAYPLAVGLRKTPLLLL